MAGIEELTRWNIGKETVRGTPVAPTTQMYVDLAGAIDDDTGLTFHEAENVGRRSVVRRVTQQTEDFSAKLKSSAGWAFDDFRWPLSQLKGGQTGTGAGADKTWAGFVPGMSSAANNPESYSVDYGDDVQNWRAQYVMMSRWKISAALGGLTEFECDVFGQRTIKGAAAAVSPPATPPVKIPAELWTFKYAATFGGLTGASVQTLLVTEWSLEVFTGLLWRHFLDGNYYGGGHQETAVSAIMTFRVESTAFAISEFYDKWRSLTQDYVRAKATGPALGGSAYSLQFDAPLLYDKPKVLESKDKGVNLYGIVAKCNDDLTNPPITPTLVCSQAALP